MSALHDCIIEGRDCDVLGHTPVAWPGAGAGRKGQHRSSPAVHTTLGVRRSGDGDIGGRSERKDNGVASVGAPFGSRYCSGRNGDACGIIVYDCDANLTDDQTFKEGIGRDDAMGDQTIVIAFNDCVIHGRDDDALRGRPVSAVEAERCSRDCYLAIWLDLHSNRGRWRLVQGDRIGIGGAAFGYIQHGQQGSSARGRRQQQRPQQVWFCSRLCAGRHRDEEQVADGNTWSTSLQLLQHGGTL